MKENIQISAAEGVSTIIIYEGEAEKVNNPVPHKHEGHISAPAKFIEKNRVQLVPGVSVVEFDYDAAEIRLYCDKSNVLAAVVIGRLKPNPNYTAFRINSQQKFTAKELSNHLRMRRVYFADKEECVNMVQKLMTFKAEIQSSIEQSNDLKGSKKEAFETKLSHNLNMVFKLQIPLFKCERELTFDVEVMCDVQDGDIKFWLESMDSEMLIKTEREAIIDKWTAGFDAIALIEV